MNFLIQNQKNLIVPGVKKVKQFKKRTWYEVKK